jgi:hypothetical protein
MPQEVPFNSRVAEKAGFAPHHVMLACRETRAIELHFRWIPLTQAFAAENAGVSGLQREKEHVFEAPPGSCAASQFINVARTGRVVFECLLRPGTSLIGSGRSAHRR